MHYTIIISTLVLAYLRNNYTIEPVNHMGKLFFFKCGRTAKNRKEQKLVNILIIVSSW